MSVALKIFVAICTQIQNSHLLLETATHPSITSISMDRKPNCRSPMKSWDWPCGISSQRGLVSDYEVLVWHVPKRRRLVVALAIEIFDITVDMLFAAMELPI